MQRTLPRWLSLWYSALEPVAKQTTKLRTFIFRHKFWSSCHGEWTDKFSSWTDAKSFSSFCSNYSLASHWQTKILLDALTDSWFLNIHDHRDTSIFPDLSLDNTKSQLKIYFLSAQHVSALRPWSRAAFNWRLGQCFPFTQESESEALLTKGLKLHKH